MNKIISICLLILLTSFKSQQTTIPTPESILAKLELANNYFMQKWPNPGQIIVTDKVRPSNLWTRATYYEGLMALNTINPKPEYYKYALDWGTYHQWKFQGSSATVPVIYNDDANVICAAQTYIELYLLDPKPEKIANIKLNLDDIIKSGTKGEWTWIDAIQMAMPVYAKLGVVTNDQKYFDKMNSLYLNAKTKIGGGLYNSVDHLWWRDATFVPPYKEPNGEDCYWSRGNGWVYAALVRVLDVLPKDNKYRAEYLKTFIEMSDALLKVQRSDGFWNVSLHDPNNYGGKELTGTAFFAYGFAWGINQNILSRDTYYLPTINAWNGMALESVHSNGFLGYVQGTGKEPKDGQPVTYTSVPNFEDFGLGAFLLAGAEVYKMGNGLGTNNYNFIGQNIINYPNPFSSETEVFFTIKESSKIKLSVYNLMGMKVYDMPEKTYQVGQNYIKLNRNNLSSGNYLLILSDTENQKSSKLITVQ
ncbi:glycoside hydrolase family 88 protein [Flavobacterium alvei]|uniref:glycoside hydrolase family 88 protein n=1 Tax=Flavobacterium alvei TaxID=2080416 RepID=UPI0026F3362A|nr:glycoside hydrolase family 88 protein [Flavobacterium alvei]